MCKIYKQVFMYNSFIKLILFEITHTQRPTAICSMSWHGLRATGKCALLKCNCNVLRHTYVCLYVCPTFITFPCLRQRNIVTCI